MEKIYPRTGDTQTVYLNAVVKDPSIEVGDYTQPRAADNRQVLFHCLRREIPVELCQPYLEILIYLHLPALL